MVVKNLLDGESAMKIFVVFLFSFVSLFAGAADTVNLIHTVPDFYYVENEGDEDGMVLVYACSVPVGAENISIGENQSNLILNCPTVLEVAASDLRQFTSRLNEELHTGGGKAVLSAYGMVGSFGVGLLGTLNFIDPIMSKRANITTLVVSSVVFLGSIVWLSSDYGNVVPTHRKHLAEQINAGIIKDENGNPHLKIFTDFLNQFGVLHHSN